MNGTECEKSAGPDALRAETEVEEISFADQDAFVRLGRCLGFTLGFFRCGCCDSVSSTSCSLRKGKQGKEVNSKLPLLKKDRKLAHPVSGRRILNFNPC